jgi:hypothetical protein
MVLIAAKIAARATALLEALFVTPLKALLSADKACLFSAALRPCHIP